jgi:glycosyltransferase involved in cell wall biosynthesis
MHAPLQFLVDHPKPGAKLSVILLDWGVRESFHSLHYLNRQTVDRSQYELIWLEFYDHKPSALLEAVRAAENEGQPLVDKLVVLNQPRDLIFHKHRLYNLGIVLAQGQICVICDSDAMFTPTFVERIVTAFERDPWSVIHLDEVRSGSREFYPFNYPSFDEFLASPCHNWTGTTTRGLNNSRDMLHQANYGACLAARRDDLIRIGGSDEHLEYLGYICGPYELTFRLANAGCTERWLKDEYLYHTWHPGESGFNLDYHGPSDGAGMSSRALEVRRNGRVQPALENGAIRALRANPSLDRRSALQFLASPDDAQWRDAARFGPGERTVRLVEKAFARSYDIYSYRCDWYAVPTSDEPLDLDRAKAGLYRRCLRADTREEVERLVRLARWVDWLPEKVRGGYRRLRLIAGGCLELIGVGPDRPVIQNTPLPDGVERRTTMNTSSDRGFSVTLLVPTLNEVDGMRVIMPRVRPEWVDQIVILDGGSTDGTIEYARENGYFVHVQHERGIRQGYMEVLPYITGDVVLTFSPDGNSIPELIPDLVDKIAEGYDMVIASRYLGGAKSEDDDFLTSFGNWFFTKTVNWLFRANYTDVMVIYRAYWTDLISILDLDKDESHRTPERLLRTRISWEPLLSARAAKMKLRITEIPGDEPPRIGGERKLQVWKWGAAYYFQFLREFFLWKKPLGRTWGILERENDGPRSLERPSIEEPVGAGAEQSAA